MKNNPHQDLQFAICDLRLKKASAGLQSQVPNCRSQIAFTLLEMLITIGIIVLLIGILIPVIGNVRQSAYVTSTSQLLSNLTGAIERYYQDFKAYPGPIPNTQIGGNPTLPPSNWPLQDLGGATVTPVTQSENLVLGLLGGLQLNTSGGTPSGFQYDPQRVRTKKGPVVLNPAASPNKQYAAYMDVKPEELSEGDLGDDSIIPEFLDRFPDPKPVIYLRARAGAPNIISASNSDQYNSSHLSAYGFPVGSGTIADPTLKKFFENPSLAGTARQKDGYILITAGKDRRFGTNDDLCNFGKVGD